MARCFRAIAKRAPTKGSRFSIAAIANQHLAAQGPSARQRPLRSGSETRLLWACWSPAIPSPNWKSAGPDRHGAGRRFGLVLLISMAVSFLIRTTALLRVASEVLSAAREQRSLMAQGLRPWRDAQTMDMLVNSAQRIADPAAAVLTNAEEHAQRLRHITDCIDGSTSTPGASPEHLADHADRRPDLLALNAAPRAPRRRPARASTLVAAEMRRLAKNVMESVSGISSA